MLQSKSFIFNGLQNMCLHVVDSKESRLADDSSVECSPLFSMAYRICVYMWLKPLGLQAEPSPYFCGKGSNLLLKHFA